MWHKELGEKSDCEKRVTEATQELGQKNIKGAAKDNFLFGGWFASKSLAEYSMDVGSDIIVMFKKDTK